MKTLIALLLVPQILLADASFKFTNDFFAPDGLDRWLTNEFVITYDEWSFGQEMYTPKDKRNPGLPVNDRPWDGYTYLGYTHTSELTPVETKNYTFRVGALGDASKAKRVQKFVHNDLGAGSDPQGWDTQNKSQIALDFIYEHEHKYLFNSWFLDTVGVQSYGVRLGNVKDEAFINQEIHKTLFDSVTGSIGLRGSAVLFDTTLDGRLFSSSDTYTVDHEYLVAEFYSGLRFRLPSEWHLSYFYRYRTAEFKGQDGRHILGEVIIGREF